MLVGTADDEAAWMWNSDTAPRNSPRVFEETAGRAPGGGRELDCWYIGDKNRRENFVRLYRSSSMGCWWNFGESRGGNIGMRGEPVQKDKWRRKRRTLSSSIPVLRQSSPQLQQSRAFRCFNPESSTGLAQRVPTRYASPVVRLVSKE